jgi:drug/metabolite transporter (DMT)-like permease
MIYLILFILLTILSQVLLKQASLNNVDLKTGSYLVRMLKTPKVLFAYALSGINIFIWIIALSKIPLITAFFIASSIYVIMVLVDHFLFKERINFIKVLGAFFISIGVMLSLI